MRFPYIFLFLPLLLLSICPTQAAGQPNVLFFFMDDQRFDTIAALGNPVIKTPNIDRLVRRGVSFNRAYMQGGLEGATCVPSRAMLLSGRNLFHCDRNLIKDETWPAAFGRAGYATFISGKWHNGDASLPLAFKQGASVFMNGMAKDPIHAPLSDLREGKISPRIVSSKHICEMFADEAIRFLGEQGKKDSPFFCYIPFDGPHDPHIVPADFPISYKPESIPLPPNFLPQHPWNNGEMLVRDERLLPWPRTPSAVLGMLAEYYRYVSFLDVQIGRVLDTLEASPFAADTYIVFAADSGVARGSHGLIGKQNVYEHSMRVPLIVAGPGIPADKRTDAMCYLFDLLPTLGKLCGVEGPSTSEGVDLSPSLKDPSKPARPQLMFAYRNVQRGFRDERWKLIRYPQVDKVQLFDLQADPAECANLADKPEFAGRVEELTAALEAEMKRNGDSAPLKIAAPKPAEWSPPPGRVRP